MSAVSATTNSALASPPRQRRATILGVGAYLPPGVLTNAALATMVETSDTWIMERTGIRQRHQVASGETTATMGTRAARQAMAMAGVDDVDAIICATCSPDTLVPASACLIQRELGLPHLMPAFDINAACSGFVYGVRLATSLIESDAASTVLVICSEAMTRLIDYGDRTTCVLFGDGAGAVLVGAGDEHPIRAIRWGADGSEAEIIFFGPKQEDEASEDHLRMAGRGTFRLAVERLAEMAEELLTEAGWSIEEVDHFIPHQANQRIIEAAAKRIGIPDSKLVLNVAEVGNTSAASIPLALAGAHAEGRLHRGDKIVCIAFGAGATWGGVALEWAL